MSKKNKIIVIISYYVMFHLIPFKKIHDVFFKQVDRTWYILMINLALDLVLVALLVIFYRKEIKQKFWEIVKKPFGVVKEGIIDTLIFFFFRFTYAFLVMTFKLETTESINQLIVDKTFEISPILILVMTCFFAPLIEEMIFRKIIFKEIRKYNKVVAYIVSSALFSLIHLLSSFGILTIRQIIFNFITYFIPGIALASIYEHRNNIRNAIIAHSIANFISLLILKTV